ncbi:hypothetical protein [Gluconobacter sp. GP1]|uniref:hypothetical protein n=1 Tax=Gluconobacter sp. GP1 TaxID=3046423 RepID=UPI00293F6740|nr:hypothetical protein [Gluconobacter sp. GP1]
MSVASHTTIEELRSICTDAPMQILFRSLLCCTYDDFCEICDDAVGWASQEISRNPQLKQGRSEDELTLDIVGYLRAMGFSASHDTMTGGHSDILIEKDKKFLWWGEAKIHRDYDWLLSGYDQLSTRYMTGALDQNRGALIIYNYGSRSDSVIGSWREYLEYNVDGITINSCPKDNNSFISSHIHSGTGVEVKIRHSIVSLYRAPAPKRKGKKPPKK